MPKSLYEISQDLLDIQYQIEISEGDITPEIQEKLAINAANFKDKALNYTKFIRQLNLESEMLSSEESRLSKLRKAKENLVSNLKLRLLDYMKVSGTEKEDLGLFKLTLANSPAAVTIKGTVPDTFMKVVTEPNKTAIKDYLKEGNAVEWAELTSNKYLKIS